MFSRFITLLPVLAGVAGVLLVMIGGVLVVMIGGVLVVRY